MWKLLPSSEGVWDLALVYGPNRTIKSMGLSESDIDQIYTLLEQHIYERELLYEEHLNETGMEV